MSCCIKTCKWTTIATDITCCIIGAIDSSLVIYRMSLRIRYSISFTPLQIQSLQSILNVLVLLLSLCFGRRFLCRCFCYHLFRRRFFGRRFFRRCFRSSYFHNLAFICFLRCGRAFVC